MGIMRKKSARVIRRGAAIEERKVRPRRQTGRHGSQVHRTGEGAAEAR